MYLENVTGTWMFIMEHFRINVPAWDSWSCGAFLKDNQVGTRYDLAGDEISDRHRVIKKYFLFENGFVMSMSNINLKLVKKIVDVFLGTLRRHCLFFQAIQTDQSGWGMSSLVEGGACQLRPFVGNCYQFDLKPCISQDCWHIST